MARKRTRWEALKRRLEADRLVFVDETWIKTDMAPPTLQLWAFVLLGQLIRPGGARQSSVQSQ